LIGGLIPGRPELARRMDCRFSRTLYPGTPIRTMIWKTGEGQAVWRTIDLETGKPVMDNGVFEYGEIPRETIDFSGRVAVVTGAGAGLGRAYAVELAARGAKVVVNDLGGARDGSGPGSMSAADAVVEEIRNSGGVAVANYDNVATPEGGQAIIDTAIREFGRVDILINNAGILRDKTLMNMEPENWRAVMDVHLNGACHVTRPAFARMKEQGFGRIIFTTSAAGLYGNFGQTNYSAAKMGLVGFMNTLKLEGMKYDVKVNTVAPLAASRLTEDVMPPELLERSRPEFVVPMVLYLCSHVCDVTGRVYNAGMGYYSRAAVVTGTGVRLGTDDVPPTPEEVLEAWEKIESLEGGKEAGSLVEALIEMQNAAPPTPALHQAGREKKEKA
jgi:NAD(P)-dependent dehydrogenase (short-subunit alcohol dehydrogenase family)